MRTQTIAMMKDMSVVSRAWERLRGAFPYLVAAGLFALGLFALYRVLAHVNLHDITAQLRATPPTVLILAVFTTLCGYLALAGYDWSALHYIGKPLPLPVVLTGGLMAYAFGNTTGLSLISGGAVRWRIYSRLGLDAYDIAAVSTFAAVSYGTAATVVGLAALAVHPTALLPILPLSPAMVRLVAIGAVAVIVLPLVAAAWFGRDLRVGRFHLPAPRLVTLGGQVLFSLADIGFSALTLYLLLPPVGLSFLSFLAIFTAATMAGIVSHVPGGVGVFETVMIAAMPAGVPLDQVAAALVLFRLTYYVLPFAVALVMLAVHETWRTVGGHVPAGALGRVLVAMEPAFDAIRPAAPMVLGVMVFGSGLWMSVAALIPAGSGALEFTEALLPLAFVEGAVLLSSAIGAALIVLSFGIVRRSLGAFWLAMATLFGGVGVALAQELDYERAATLLAAAFILLPFRRTFDRRTALTHAVLTPGWLILVSTALFAFAFVLFFAHKGTAYTHELWWQFALDAHAPRSLRAGFTASLIIGLLALYLLLRAPRFRPAAPDAAALAGAAAIVSNGDDPAAALALTGDKTLLFSEDGRAFVMFALSGRSWIALGGPVGPARSAEEAALAFVTAARKSGARPVFYEIGPEHLPLMLDLGLSLHKIGEKAWVDLTSFSLDGPARRGLRATLARARRDGLAFEIARPPHGVDLRASLKRISAAWLETRGAREKGFSVGRFDPDWLDRWPIALARHHGQPVAFANILAARPGAAATIDLMRHGPEAPPGTMEFLLTEVMLRLKDEGYRAFSLGMAPLSGLASQRTERLWHQIGDMIYRHGERFYGFTGLRAFKEKFHPVWQPAYLAAPSSLPPLLPVAEAARLIAAPVGAMRRQAA